MQAAVDARQAVDIVHEHEGYNGHEDRMEDFRWGELMGEKVGCAGDLQVMEKIFRRVVLDEEAEGMCRRHRRFSDGSSVA